ADHIPEAEQVRLRVDPEVGRTGEWAPREDRGQQHRLDALLERVERESLVASSLPPQPVRELRELLPNVRDRRRDGALGVEAGHGRLGEPSQATGPLVELLASELALPKMGLDARERRLGDP